MSSLILLPLFPIIGALIGWLTNRVAIQMLFRPRNPVNFLGMRFQGLVPRRQEELAAKTAELVAEEIIQGHVLREEVEKLPIGKSVEQLVDRLLYHHLLPRFREIPLVGGFLNDKLMMSIRSQSVEALKEEMPALLKKLGDVAEAEIDIRSIVEEKILAFEVEALETVVKKLAAKEFRTIEALGAVLGGLVGLIQAGLVTLAG